MIRRIFALVGYDLDAHDGDGAHISTAHRRALLRHEMTRGVDLPTWRTPKEIAEMRREARAIVRAAKGD